MSAAPLQLDFPASLDPMGPRGLVASMSAIERGAFYSLLLTAWLEDPPCSLVNDDTLLAAIAGMRPEEWAPAKPRLFLAFQPGQDGRVHNPFARKVYAGMVLDVNARRDRTRAATQARLRGRGPDHPPPRPDVTSTSRQRNETVTSTSRSFCAPSALSLVLSSAPAPQRPASTNELSAQEGAQDRDSSKEPGAGARALLKARDNAWNFRLLSMASFPWAADLDKETIPHTLCRSLADHPNAFPMRIAFALERIEAMGRRPEKPGRERTDPIKLIIAALGAQHLKQKPPWDVPVVFSLHWAKREEERKKTQELQSHLDDLRRQAVSRTPPPIRINPQQGAAS